MATADCQQVTPIIPTLIRDGYPVAGGAAVPRAAAAVTISDVAQHAAASAMRHITKERIQTYLNCAWDLGVACSNWGNADSRDNVRGFHSASVPQLALSEYVIRLSRRLEYDRATVLVALVLAERFWQRHPPSKLAAHRLFATLVLVASKLTNDRVWRNVDVAVNCGLSLRELNSLEVALLKTLQHNIFVSEADVLALSSRLDKAIQLRSLAAVASAFGVSLPRSPAQTPAVTDLIPEASASTSSGPTPRVSRSNTINSGCGSNGLLSVERSPVDLVLNMSSGSASSTISRGSASNAVLMLRASRH